MRRPLLLMLGAALAGCGADPTTPKPPGTTRAQAALVAVPTCADVTATLRESARREMNARLDAALENALASQGQPCAVPASGSPESRVAAPTGTGAPADAKGGASSYSTTNNQVAGVDEADFLKNDGKYLYLVGGGALRIVQAWPAQDTRAISVTKIEGEARKLFVEGDRAVVYSSLPALPAEPAQAEDARAAPSAVARPLPPGKGGNRECTYGFDCEFTGDGRPSKITILDISDRSRPVVLRELVSSSSYVNARRVGAAIHTVLASRQGLFPAVQTWPQEIRSCDVKMTADEIRAAFARLRAANAEIIDQTDVSGTLPSVTDTVRAADGSVKRSARLLDRCPGFYAEGLKDGDAFTTVLSLDLSRDEAPSSTTVLSRPGAVYASAGALYLSVPREQTQFGVWYREHAETKQLSTVHKFTLDNERAAARYAASGVVKGRVLNQFAMDEREGHLRIATTTGRAPDPKAHSTLTVLAEAGGKLDPVGVVDQIAPTEDIRSVRFDGKRGYVVTFKKTDPLFVFDLSDPRAPRMEAELKIPGFSTYMHRMDDEHLLTIGYDAAEQGSFAYFTGVLLQIFDVSNPKDPRLVHKHVIGTRGSSSEALTNHLAFNYYAPKEALLLPMTICEGGDPNRGGHGSMTFSGLMVFDTTAAQGFKERGRVLHPAGAGVDCGNWWTNATSQVKRSVVMEDFVYSISDSRIKVNRLGDLTAEVAAVSLTE